MLKFFNGTALGALLAFVFARFGLATPEAVKLPATRKCKLEIFCYGDTIHIPGTFAASAVLDSEPRRSGGCGRFMAGARWAMGRQRRRSSPSVRQLRRRSARFGRSKSLGPRYSAVSLLHIGTDGDGHEQRSEQSDGEPQCGL